METPDNILKYLKDSKEFLRKLKKTINKNMDYILKQETQKVIKKEFFPKDKIIRELYNEIFACYYSNLHNASLSLAMELLEHLSKKKYSEFFRLDYPKKSWEGVLDKLRDYCKNNNDRMGEEILRYVNKYRDKVRNAQNHGNITQLVEENSKFYHKATNVNTGESRPLPLKYTEGIHGEGYFLKAKEKIQNQGTNFSIFLINAFIIHFFIIHGEQSVKN